MKPTRLMRDQCGNPVPDDLVLLPDYGDLDDAGRARVDAANWYVPAGELSGPIMASAGALFFLSEDDPEDAGVDVSAGVLYVAAALHRGNAADGFYHA